jgi:NADH-quinone oxidoreductase subunit E
LKERSETLQGRLEVSERLREESAPRWLMSAPKGSKDDLKEIRGLGPTLERNLNRLGIFHFHQLARMTSKDAHWIAGRINAFTGLNKRYRWVEQARLRKGRIVGRPGGNGARAREDH